MAGRKPREPKLRDLDLLKRFDRVNLSRFGGLVCGGIGWRTFPMGSNVSLALCAFRERFVAVNKILDDKRVPLWYVDFVLYHEMLHLQLGSGQSDPDGYAYPHDLRFQCLERRHPDYDRALEFENTKLYGIISAHRKWREWEKSSAPRLRLAAKRRNKKK